MQRDKIIRAITLVGGLGFLLVGLWAFFGPHSFYERVAEFPPYNRHFIHDIGAFNIGIGLSLLFALAQRNAVQVVLGAAGVGSAFHAIGHFLDKSLGGKSSDPYVFSLLALILIVAAVIRLQPSE
ncbi:MAG: hypothetical protein ABR548_04730 [Actinomycetota bacterium]|nr:hypothetical protein [Actinomycetota bacterium]